LAGSRASFTGPKPRAPGIKSSRVAGSRAAGGERAHRIRVPSGVREWFRGPRARRLARRIASAPPKLVALGLFGSLVLALTVPSLIPANAPADAAPGNDVGTVDFSFQANGVKAPTGRKPEAAKLWINDGSWWGVLFVPARDAYMIERFDWPTGTWVDTGVMVDDRNAARADALWDGNHLYMVSGGTDPAAAKHRAVLLRYSYDGAAKRYSPDSGFPVALTRGGAETFTLAKDSGGRVWVTFASDGRVYATHSLASDRDWTVPFALPIPEAQNLTPDDIAAPIAHDGKISVMWSDQTDGAMYFASHADGADDAAWTLSTAIQGPSLADDHMNLHSLSNDPAGQVFAVVKTSLNDDPNPDPEKPLIVLLVLKSNGVWEKYVVGRVKDNQTRPLLLIDLEHRRLYVFMTAPCCSGGSIYYKSSSLDQIDFPDGDGTIFMRRGRSGLLNNPTSTHQNLDGSTGLLVLAADDKSNLYMHNTLSLSGPSVALPTTGQPVPGAPGSPLPGASDPGRGSVTGPPVEWLVDGFESGRFGLWTTARSGPGSVAAVQPGQGRSGANAAHFSAMAAVGSFAFARYSLPSSQPTVRVSLEVKLEAEGPAGANVPFLRLFNDKGSRLAAIYRQNLADERLWVSAGAGRQPTSGRVDLKTWAHLDVDVLGGGDAATIVIRLDGKLIYQAAAPLIKGSAVRTIQIGSDSKGQPFDMYVDDVRIYR